MRVICTDRNIKTLTLRHEYTVINESEKKYKILNEDGKYHWYSKKKLTEVMK